MTTKTETDEIKKDDPETEKETVTVVIEKDESKTEDEKPDVSESAAEHAVEMAERATELAQINAAQAIVEDQEFKQWVKNEIQNLSQIVNEIAILQVSQAEATAAIQENQLLSASTNSPAEEVQTVTDLETEAEAEAEADQNENNDNQEPLEKLREITRRVKSRIRVL